MRAGVGTRELQTVRVGTCLSENGRLLVGRDNDGRRHQQLLVTDAREAANRSCGEPSAEERSEPNFP